jgi:hypothetical protein
MKPLFRRASRRSTPIAVAAGFAAAALAASGLAVAATADDHPSNAINVGRGIDQFGMIGSSIHGQHSISAYAGGFVCDTSVASAANSGCEVGEKAKQAPAGPLSPLYALVPIGFKVNGLECPPGLVCVDHPGTIDMTRLADGLKPLFPDQSLDQLRESLKNAPAPGHNHFLTTLAGGKPRYWEVKIIGVTDKALYEKLSAGHDFAVIDRELKAKNKHLVGPLPSNIFLYFSAKRA